jgi:HD-GYP domain-containing protein (c-di-GMP phosphodiesterase class II)
MMKESDFQKRLTRVISQMIAAISNLRLYLYDHPYISDNMERSYGELLDLLALKETITIFLVGEEIVVNHRALSSTSQSTEKFVRILKSKGIERVTFLSGLSKAEFLEFMRDLASPDGTSVSSRRSIKLGKVEIRISNGMEPAEATASEQASCDLLEHIVSLTEYEAHEVEALYFMVERGKQVDVQVVDQIVRRFVTELRRNLSPIYMLASVKSTDEYTFTHLANVCILTMSLAEKLGFSGKQLHDIGIASLLHDVGKTCIPEEILSKPGKLTPEERAVIETHPVKGCRYLMELGGVPKIAVLAALEHHLKFDGSGYPSIRPDWKPHVVAQMITIADVFDALRSRRPYSDPKPMEVIVGILQKERGTTFNPLLVDSFLGLISPTDAGANGNA